MHKKSRRLAIVVAALLGCFTLEGCSANGAPAPGGGTRASPTPCSSRGVCKIVVTVDKCGFADGTAVDPVYVETGTAYLDPATGTQHLSWEIDTWGYEFANDPIKFFLLNGTPVDGDFELDSHGSTKKKLRFKNLNIKSEEYKYSIQVRPALAGICQPLDPWIRNVN